MDPKKDDIDEAAPIYDESCDIPIPNRVQENLCRHIDRVLDAIWGAHDMTQDEVDAMWNCMCFMDLLIPPVPDDLPERNLKELTERTIRRRQKGVHRAISKFLVGRPSERPVRCNAHSQGKPCQTLGWCPYGVLVEQFPLLPESDPRQCRRYGHLCPAFEVAEAGGELDQVRMKISSSPT